MPSDEPPYPYEPPPSENAGKARAPVLPSWAWLALVLGVFVIVMVYGFVKAMDAGVALDDQDAPLSAQESAARSRRPAEVLPPLGGGESVFTGHDPLGEIVEGRANLLAAPPPASRTAGLAVSDDGAAKESDPKKSVSLIDDRPITVDGVLQLSDP